MVSFPFNKRLRLAGLGLVGLGILSTSTYCKRSVEGERPTAISGCDVVLSEAGPLRCMLETPKRKVVLWLEGENVLELEARLSSWRTVSLPVEYAHVVSGTRVVVEVDHAGVLEISGRTDEPKPGPRRTWVVELGVRPESEDGDEPWQVASTWERRAEDLPSERVEDAVEAFEKALAIDPRELSVRCRLLRKLGYLHFANRNDVMAAREASARMEACEALGPAHTAPQAFTNAELALSGGHDQAALEQFELASTGAEQLALDELLLAATMRIGTLKSRLEQHEGAREAFERARALIAELPVDCKHALDLTMLEFELATKENGPAPSTSAIDELAKCPISTVVDQHKMLTLAYAEVSWQRYDAADRWLDRIDLERSTPVVTLFAASIRADAALGRREWSAAAEHADRLATLLEAQLDADPELEVQLDFVRGRVALAGGDLTRAEGLLRSAIAKQEELLRRVPLGLSASRVSAREAEPARYLVELLRQRGDLEAAACAARLLRNRAAWMLVDAARFGVANPALLVDLELEERALEQAESGSAAALQDARAAHRAAKQRVLDALAHGGAELGRSQTCDALPKPVPGELTILHHQDPEGTWWQLDWSLDDPVRFVELGRADPESEGPASAARFLEPVRDRLSQVEQLRLLASGSTHGVLFESLPWDGATLEERVDVRWGLDLPRRAKPTPNSAPAVKPLVVFTDPLSHFTRDLPAIDAIFRAAVRTWGPDVVQVRDEKASIRDVRELVGEATLLLIVGHNSAIEEFDVSDGKCSNGRGPRGPEPLQPPDGIWTNWTSLDQETILTLDPPPVAILESCATGPVDALSLGGAVGLGHIVVAAGSEQVLVTRRIVCAKEAFAFTEALIEALGPGPLDLVAALRMVRDKDPYYEHRVLGP